MIIVIPPPPSTAVVPLPPVVPPPPVTVPPPPPSTSWVPTVPASVPELPPPPQVVYDTETYPNLFCLVARAMESDQTWTFEISPRRNDLLGLLAWIDDLSRRGVEMIGFNNLGFDYPVLHEIIVNPQCRTPDAIYQKAMSIIRGQGDNRFGSMVWESDRRVPQLDLFKIHHFDNKARSTGLKALQFAMRSDGVEDLPFPVGIMLTPQQMDVTLRYCLHDVTETKKFAEKSRESIELRRTLTTKYKRNFMNHNDTKIGKDYLIMRLGEEVCYTRDPSTGKRAPRQTLRPTIALGEVILPYVRYSHPGFNAVLGWLRRQVITETKGVFGNIELQDEGKAFGVDLNHQNIADLPRYADPSTVKTKDGGLRMTKLNCRVNGFTFVFGTGGIHGSVEGVVIVPEDDEEMEDIDVESYYPNIAIKNGLYPEHLGERFCVDYEDVFQQRKQFKKGTPENAVMKLALNGTYGDSNNPYSPFYDPKFTMSITINGQLLLCMLAEQLFNVPGLELIQINTDGMTVKYKKCHKWLVKAICDWWQDLTKLTLESAFYKKMVIRDVNSYIAVKTNGKVKLKGAYLAHNSVVPKDDPRNDNKRGWHQDQSALIVPMAAEAVMVKGASLEEFIRLHTDPFDFMCRAKAPRGSRLMVGDRQTQNTLRYYVSTDGQPLTKVSPPVEGAVEGQYKRKNGVNDQIYQAWHAANGNVWNPEFHTGNKSVYATRIMSICSGWRITECNAASQFSWNNLDFQWYIDEAKKLIIGHDHLLGSPV